MPDLKSHKKNKAPSGDVKSTASYKRLEKKVQELSRKCKRSEVHEKLLKEIAYTTSKGFRLEAFLDMIHRRKRRRAEVCA